MSFQSTTVSNSLPFSQRWIAGCRSLSRSWLWQATLIGIGSLSNVVYTCTFPFVGLAAISGATLTRRQAMLSTVVLWFANQFCGYRLHHYPQTINCFLWGWALLVGMILVTWIANQRPLFSQGNLKRHYLQFALALVLGFVVFQAVIWFSGLSLGGASLTPKILGGIFVGNVVWAVLLIMLHGVLVRKQATTD